jgi:hypothetical protein
VQLQQIRDQQASEGYSEQRPKIVSGHCVYRITSKTYTQQCERQLVSPAGERPQPERCSGASDADCCYQSSANRSERRKVGARCWIQLPYRLERATRKKQSKRSESSDRCAEQEQC